MKEALTKLLKVKSLVTLALTAGMLFLLSGIWQPSQEIITIYSTAFGSVMTYFFTKKDEENDNSGYTNENVE